ncbi:MAG: hypothetical protein GQ574_01800 [Crocinitomix sp.]|nr:hypothetical protein [Crocinitomix sp.]
MKTLLLIVTLFATTFGFSQSKITLTLNGLTEEVNAALQPGELIQNLEGLDRLKYVFYVKVQNTAGGSSKYVKIQQSIEPNAEGKYDFSLTFDVPKTGTLDFSKEIKVKIEGSTTFGNDIWVEKTIAPADFDKPIWIDSYGNSFRPERPKKEVMKFTFTHPGKTDSITKVVEAQGDVLKKPMYIDIHLQAKNVGDDAWAINDCPVRGSIVGKGQYEYTLDPKDTKLDLSQPIFVHICVKTFKGGIIWRELTIQPWELGGQYAYGFNYSSVQECELPSKDDVVEEEEEEVVEDEIVEEEEEEKEKEEDATDNSSDQVNKPAPVISAAVNKCKADSLTSQIALKGGKLCVQHTKVSRGTTNSAILLYDTDYLLDGVTYSLKGGQPVYYHNKSNYLLGATLAEAITVAHPLGQLELQADRKIEFTAIGLYAVKLSKEAVIDYNGTKLTVKTTANEFDLAFDKLSRLRYLTLGSEATWKIGTTEIKLPADSYLSFDKDKLKRVQLVNATEVKIGENTFSVVPAKKGASIKLDSGANLEAFTIGDGHSIMVDGKEVSIQSGSEVEVMNNGSGYIITSVETAAPITMDVHKGSKVKVVDVKAGKRLVIEDGKVVKVK